MLFLALNTLIKLANYSESSIIPLIKDFLHLHLHFYFRLPRPDYLIKL